MSIEGGEFLHSINPTLHTQGVVEYAQERRKFEEKDTSQRPPKKIDDWLEVIEKTHTSHRDDSQVMDRIRGYYHDLYVIKEEDIPQGYWNSLANFMIKEGRGKDLEQTGVKVSKVTDKNGIETANYIFPEYLKKQQSESLINDQKATLDDWINYFTSPDSDAYPTWVKYWAFNGMVKLSRYDKENKVFGSRDRGTVAPFADINREALAYVVDAVVKKAKKENIPDQENNADFKQLLQGANFGKLYSYAIEKVIPTEQNKLQETRGEWVKYNQGSDHMPLVNSIQGYGTGWCTAGESTAKAQLETGDFYVFYSLDEEGKATVPRVAIRMSGNKIGEVRGIAENQNLDPFVNEVVDKKLEEFSDGENYKKRLQDMKYLTLITEKIERGENLSKEDLRFLYEIDSKIEGFGYNKDPRIENIILGRDVKSDIALSIGCGRDEVSLTKKEALKGGVKYHYGYLDLSSYKFTIMLRSLPKVVGGTLDLSGLKSIKGFDFPELVNGAIRLNSLTHAERLNFPSSINGKIYLDSLTFAKDLFFPESMNDSIEMENLKYGERIKFPNLLNGNIKLKSLTFAKDLFFPESVEGYIDLESLTSAKGVKLPKYVRGSVNLNSLTDLEGITLPESLPGGLILGNLKSAEGLHLSKSMQFLDLRSLTSSEGLNLPESITYNLNLDSLKFAKGLKFPKSVGRLYLSSLISGEGVEFPEEVEDINLDGLTSAEGLKLPESIWSIHLDGLKSATGLHLPKVLGYLYLRGLTSAEDLNLPKILYGSLDLGGLTSVKGSILPTYVGGDIDLNSLTSSEGLNLPETVMGTISLKNLPVVEKEKLKTLYPNHHII